MRLRKCRFWVQGEEESRDLVLLGTLILEQVTTQRVWDPLALMSVSTSSGTLILMAQFVSNDCACFLKRFCRRDCSSSLNVHAPTFPETSSEVLSMMTQDKNHILLFFFHLLSQQNVATGCRPGHRDAEGNDMWHLGSQPYRERWIPDLSFLLHPSSWNDATEVSHPELN